MKRTLASISTSIQALIGSMLIVLLSAVSPVTLADPLQDHLGLYHDGYSSEETDSDQLRMARLAVLGYGAKQGLKSMGVDYRQAQQVFKRLTVHSVTATSVLLIEPNRINFLTRHQEGAFMTELSGKPDGEVGLSIKIPF